jgi:hypothetical protein
MDVESLAKQLILKGMTEDQQKAILESIKTTMTQARTLQKQRVGENVQVVVQALKKLEADIRDRYDEVGNKIEKRVATIKDGKDGLNGKDGRDGKDGRPGRDGVQGPRGVDGLNGNDGRDGDDGVSVTDAHIDFDGSLTIILSNGREINVGEVVAPDLAERIKVITNGGGTSQYVMDALDSLQNVILGAGTANGVAFLNASKVLVTGSALTFDGATLINTAGPIGAAGFTALASGGEGGQIGLQNPTNTGDVAALDVLNATTARLFTQVNNAALLIGQLSGTGGVTRFFTAANERMCIDSAGNVGIGTSSPTYRLDNTGVSRLGSAVSAVAPSATDILSTAHTILSGAGGNSLTFGQYPVAQNFAQWIQSSFTNPTIGTYNLVLQPLGGNVGIGTSSPLYPLHVVKAGTPQIGLSGDSTNEGQLIFAAVTAGRVGVFDAVPLILGTNNTERMRIDSSGNVGIGTSSPGDKLEIGGAGAGIILASPNGTRYRITVSNLGVLTVAAV